MFCQVCSVFLNSSPGHKTPAWHRCKNDKPAKGGLVVYRVGNKKQVVFSHLLPRRQGFALSRVWGPIKPAEHRRKPGRSPPRLSGGAADAPFRGGPGFREAQGTTDAEGGGRAGVLGSPFFADFLWRSKESQSACGTNSRPKSNPSPCAPQARHTSLAAQSTYRLTTPPNTPTSLPRPDGLHTPRTPPDPRRAPDRRRQKSSGCWSDA